tara:strand:- start:923 stop:1375 length:453 start_codon:yes stop_codon:yes gene_type:complete
MLYFAYGSNLNWHQMKEERCPGSKYIQSYILKGYKLIFSHRNPNNKYGHANIEKNINFSVPGAIWNLTKKHESTLDDYEAVNYNPQYYYKEYFRWKGKRVLVYIQKIYTKRKPASSYLHTIIEGYKDCNLDMSYLKKRISNYTLSYKVHW